MGVETEQDDTAEWRVFQYPYLLQLIASFNGWRELKSLLLVCKSSGLFRLWLTDTAFKAETLKMVPSLTPVVEDECTIAFYDQNWKLAREETVMVHTDDALFNSQTDLTTHLSVTVYHKDRTKSINYNWKTTLFDENGYRLNERSYRPDDRTNVELLNGLHYYIDEVPFEEKNLPLEPKLWNEYKENGYLSV